MSGLVLVQVDVIKENYHIQLLVIGWCMTCQELHFLRVIDIR